MTSVSRVSLFVLCFVALALGCQPGGGSTAVEDPGLSTKDLIKNDLQMVVDNAQMGSEMMSIQNNLEKLKADDPALAEELLADLQELEGMTGDQAAQKAQEMISKLEGGASGGGESAPPE